MSAREKAENLDRLNHERRAIEAEMQEDAFTAVEKLHLNKELPLGLCLYDEGWHQGVVGLVASRVKEKVHRPVIAFAKDSDDTIKGSARSIKGVHIRDVIDAIATRDPELVLKFGGHAMAAGLTIPLQHFIEFQQRFAEEIGRHVTKEALRGQIDSDGKLEQQYLTLPTAELIRQAGPWGQGFPEPLFDDIFQLVDQRIVGERHLKVTVQLPGSQYFIDGIAFNVDCAIWPDYHCQKVHLAYRLDINEYQGRRKLQLLIESICGLK